MKGAATLLHAGQLQLFDGVGNLLQVLLGKVKIAGCHLQIFVTKQKLNSTQVRAGFK
jgi:hypothetical protein